MNAKQVNVSLVKMESRRFEKLRGCKVNTN